MFDGLQADVEACVDQVLERLAVGAGLDPDHLKARPCSGTRMPKHVCAAREDLLCA
jgi:hypothetical protein